MPRFKLNEDYYDRKCYLEREQVPTQTVMRNKMGALAPVYFQSMRYKLKVLAGLEPPLRGGGQDWYQPPTEILAGRHVLVPIDHNLLVKLSHNGIDEVGVPLAIVHLKSIEKEKLDVLADNDANWKLMIQENCKRQCQETAEKCCSQITHALLKAYEEFSFIYKTSITKLEHLLLDGAMKEFEIFKERARQNMMKRFRVLLKYQATQLYDEYTDKLNAKKAELKQKFLSDLNNVHKERAERLHDIRLEKHTATEKLRNLLECQKLACQVYVALKERNACTKETELATRAFNKKMRDLKNEISMQNIEIKIEKEKEKIRQQLHNQWKQKICHIVKKFQIFVQYCLRLMPEYVEFFTNMEKLMLLQLGNAATNPSAKSIIEFEKKEEELVAHPHPYFFFREGNYYPQIREDLCPKHCTSSASQLPVVVFGKRCMYAACDNLEQFTDEAIRYINGDRGNDIDVADYHNYEYSLPVKVTESTMIKEIKKQDSLMVILQQDRPNLHNVGITCCLCNIPHCFCSPRHASQMSTVTSPPSKQPSIHSLPSGSKIETREAELKHEREPKWESYMEFIRPKKCVCSKTAKKHLYEHLPPYMRNMSKFEAVEIPNYVPCSVDFIRKEVRRAKGKRPPRPVIIPPSRTREVGTQYEDIEFTEICVCLSDTEFYRLTGSFQKQFDDLSKFDAVYGEKTAAHLTESPTTFVMKQAASLALIVKDEPELQNIFKSIKCDYND